MTLYPVCIFGIIASFVGGYQHNPRFVRAGERAVLFACILVVLATAVLTIQFLQDDFNNAYVASHSNIDLPVIYKFSALWSGQEGSLLFWNCLLAMYAFAAVVSQRNRNRDLMPYVNGILLTSIFFFTTLHLFVVHPFQPLMLEQGTVLSAFTPIDGKGLNPLLQHPVMAIHPPMLYLGFVGFVVPFAFAMAALMVRSPGARWIRVTRRWTLFAWFFLTCGILLGARWAYVELGWGGYWAWDPVENASLMPWLTGTAFLHSVMIQEKKGMLKVWNVSLVIATYFLCLFGTFLTRSGVVSSVHAFAQSPIGGYFITFILVGVGLSIWLVRSRREYLQSDTMLDSVASRESSFLFNNLILLAACFAVLWGTLFPVLSEAIQGEKISVGPP
ncbi:MAG: heme lyase CcmF/NrfE family subunit, partial [Gemmatimonadetes bacterium]|nr:heme lyase CcmF/NrfE family subunit [Gemmatimonadota bacterium]